MLKLKNYPICLHDVKQKERVYLTKLYLIPLKRHKRTYVKAIHALQMRSLVLTYIQNFCIPQWLFLNGMVKV